MILLLMAMDAHTDWHAGTGDAAATHPAPETLKPQPRPSPALTPYSESPEEQKWSPQRLRLRRKRTAEEQKWSPQILLRRKHSSEEQKWISQRLRLRRKHSWRTKNDHHEDCYDENRAAEEQKWSPRRLLRRKPRSWRTKMTTTKIATTKTAQLIGRPTLRIKPPSVRLRATLTYRPSLLTLPTRLCYSPCAQHDPVKTQPPTSQLPREPRLVSYARSDSGTGAEVG